VCAATDVVAEQRTPISGATAPEAVCLRCEATDIGATSRCTPRTAENYCACRSSSESTHQVLVRAKKTAPFTRLEQYQAAQLKVLRERLKKRRASKAQVKQSINTLQKKLEAQHARLKDNCSDPSGISVPPNPPPANQPASQVEVIAKGPYTVQLLSLSGKRHSYAVAISQQGRVLGGAYQTEGATRAPAMPDGLAEADFFSQPIAPAVWGPEGLRIGCSTCQNGLYFVDLNDNGIAVGNLRAGPSSLPEAFQFNYNKQTLARIRASNDRGSLATGVNEAGIIIGEIAGSASTQGGYTQRDGVSWVGNVETVLDRNAIIAAHNQELGPIMLASIKQGLKEAQDTNECSDAEIELTKLVGGPTYLSSTGLSPIDIAATRITQRGDILGRLTAPQVTWKFTGPCQQGEGQLTILGSAFVRRADGVLAMVPGPLPLYANDFMALATDINAGLTVLGGGWSTTWPRPNIAMFQGSESKPSWRAMTAPALPDNQLFQPLALNDSADLVGIYSNDERSGPVALRGFAIIAGKLVDLTALLDRGSEWIIETATDINQCGQIAGRARNTKTGDNRAVVISPNGCPLVK
jgi:hypothetical protein